MLIDNLINEGWLKTAKIIKAFKKVKRVDFLPEEYKNLAELDEALAIGYEQTISQPLVVAFMLELLAPKAGERILDIGSGSGWTSALLAEIVGEAGKIIAMDIVPELIAMGRENVGKYNFIEKGIVEFVWADASKGYPEEAPYDKILVSASAAQDIPEIWITQLKAGGRMVAPVDNSIWLFTKDATGNLAKKEFPGFSFVPLIITP